MTSVVTTVRRGIRSGAAIKVPCKTATTANITLSGEQTIDGVAVVDGDRVLVKSQTDGTENGIYTVDTSAWDRAPDWDGEFDVKKGTLIYVTDGTTTNGYWKVTTADPITVGTTSVTIAEGFRLVNYPEETGETGVTDASYPVGDIRRYGAAVDGSTDDATAWSNAMTSCVATGNALIAPPGTSQVDSKITVTLADSTKVVTIKGTRGESIISSSVVGDATIEIIDAALCHVMDIKFTGNSLTGASGNGHALKLVDSAVGSGTYYPQQCIVERVIADGFRGNDTDGDSNAIVAAGIYIGAGLANKVRDCNATNCGHGFFFYKTQQSYLENCVATDIDKWAARGEQCTDGFYIDGCDLLSSGTALGSYSETIGGQTVPYGGVLAYACDCNVEVKRSKFKENVAQISVLDTNLITVDGNHIRPRDTNDNGQAGVWVRRSNKVNVTNNDVLYVVDAGAAYTGIEIYSLDNNGAHNYTVRGNEFNHAATVTADVIIDGNATANDTNVDIQGNLHGNSGRAGAPAVTVCTEFRNGNFSGTVKNNSFVAGDTGSSATTITDTIKIGTGATWDASNIDISSNHDKEYLTGTITNATRRTIDSGVVSDTTDGSGDITITQRLISSMGAIGLSIHTATAYHLTPHSISGQTFKVRVHDDAGAAVTSTAVSIRWSAGIS